MRIQNKLEVATRRDRALAYAFSQQVRICSKKKQIKSNSNEIGVGWSWLERWIATRLPENTMIEDQMYKQIEAVRGHQTTGMRKRLLDVAEEEKESCGSNDVFLRIEARFVAAPKDVPRMSQGFPRIGIRQQEISPNEMLHLATSVQENKGYTFQLTCFKPKMEEE